MRKYIRAWQKRSFEEKKLFLESLFWLGYYRAAILLFSLKFLTRHLKHYPPNATIDQSPSMEKIHKAVTIGNMIALASRITPWQSACLVQSLSAFRMLKKRQIPGKFSLGVLKSSTEMKAHAWTSCGECIITGESGHERFTVVSIFVWG